MPAQRTDEQIAENLRLHTCRDLCSRGAEYCACRNAIAATLARAREAGAEAMRHRAAMLAHDTGIYSEKFLGGEIPDEVRTHNEAIWLVRDKIRAIALTEVIPDGK